MTTLRPVWPPRRPICKLRCNRCHHSLPDTTDGCCSCGGFVEAGQGYEFTDADGTVLTVGDLVTILRSRGRIEKNATGVIMHWTTGTPTERGDSRPLAVAEFQDGVRFIVESADIRKQKE